MLWNNCNGENVFGQLQVWAVTFPVPFLKANAIVILKLTLFCLIIHIHYYCKILEELGIIIIRRQKIVPLECKTLIFRVALPALAVCKWKTEEVKKHNSYVLDFFPVPNFSFLLKCGNCSQPNSHGI